MGILEQIDLEALERFERNNETRDALRPMTREERLWVARLRRLAREQPKGLRVLACDGSLVVYLDGALEGHDVESVSAIGFGAKG